jgi:hypothetical protein
VCKNRRNFGYQSQLKRRTKDFDPRATQVSGRFLARIQPFRPVKKAESATISSLNKMVQPFLTEQVQARLAMDRRQPAACQSRQNHMIGPKTPTCIIWLARAPI